MLESGMTCDLAQMVMDNQNIALIRQFVRGVPVSRETLALDLIHEVGPGGDFISTDHTLRHMREASMPELWDRAVRPAWEATGGTDLARRAQDEARRVVGEHTPTPLPSEVQAELRRIVRSVDATAG
jgi:trimethylamine---corrinoid protein Co-methyltransferase